MAILLTRAVQRHEVPQVWPRITALLEPALALWRGRHSLDSLLARVLEDRMQLWVAEVDGKMVTAALTQINEWPGGKECDIAIAGGDGFDLWTEWIEDVKSWAASLGCRWMTCRGRRGWERVLAPAGFRHDGIILSAEI